LKIAIEARPARWARGTGIGNYTYCLLNTLRHIREDHQFTFLWPDEVLTDIPFSHPFTFCPVGKIDQDEERLIPQWLETENVDVYHLPQNGLRLPKKTHVHIVVTVHDLIPYIYPEMVRRSYLERFVDEMPEIVHRADRIVTVSESARQDIIRLFNAENPNKIVVIPSAPSSRYHPRPKDKCRNYLFNRYKLGHPYLLYVGGLNPRKNVAELIYAYRQVKKSLPGQHQLVIPGADGRHRQDLEGLVKQLNLKEDVVFPGFVPDRELPLFYNGADLFVYPSLYEGFGLPPLEAMASEVPVIASNASSIPEVTGEAAVLVHPKDTLALSKAIYKTLTDEELRHNLIEYGKKQVKQFRWINIGRSLISLYGSLME
jgi:glycosyltransferase involved in cell wall biosynthesis